MSSNAWPTRCPKCGAFDTLLALGGPPFPVFIRKYCDGVTKCTHQAGSSTGSDHMSHLCTGCGYVTITPCADAMSKDYIIIVPTIDRKKWWQLWR
jgi:hypothetical protein